MIDEKKEYFRKLLEIRQQELLYQKQSAQESAKPVALDQASVGRLSRMDAMQGQSMALENQRRRDLELQRIRGALLRIKNNDYGLCLSCDEEITLRRLETDPSVTLCIDCASGKQK